MLHSGAVMGSFEFPYEVNAFTWLCLSFVLIVAVFFRFGRVWSLRNVDLLLLLLVSPALLFLTYTSGASADRSAASASALAAVVSQTDADKPQTSQPEPALGEPDSEAVVAETATIEPQSATPESENGGDADTADQPSASLAGRRLAYGLLFAVTGLFLLRLLVDPLLRRRPHLVPNLNAQGLGFLCIAAFLLLALQAFQALPADSTSQAPEAAGALSGQAVDASESGTGPAALLIEAPMRALFAEYSARAIAVFSHLVVLLGLVFVGRNLFGDTQLGLGMATLYLLLPCTAFDVEQVSHVLPAALTLWALVAYRRPMVSGALLGLACGIMFFPVFLIPIWAAFYGRRGIVRFSVALLLIGSIVCSTVALTAPEAGTFFSQTIGTIHPEILAFETRQAVDGFWTESYQYYRIPVIISFFLLLMGLTFWPRRKSVENLVSASAAVITATQFWYPQQGGVYVLWYLPLLLVAMFRPRLVHLLRTDELSGAQAKRSSQLPGPHARGVTKPSERLHLFR
jgi:hypothetical protein